MRAFCETSNCFASSLNNKRYRITEVVRPSPALTAVVAVGLRLRQADAPRLAVSPEALLFSSVAYCLHVSAQILTCQLVEAREEVDHVVCYFIDLFVAVSLCRERNFLLLALRIRTNRLSLRSSTFEFRSLDSNYRRACLERHALFPPSLLRHSVARG